MKWKLLSETEEISNRWIKVRRADFELSRGTVLKDYWLVEKDAFVVVVAECDGEVILVREYRPGTDNYYLSPPAGYIDAGESILEAAQRELLEETGYEVIESRQIGEFHASPAWLAQRAFVVWASVRLASEVVELDEEISEVVKISWTKTLEKIASGEICEMQAMAALLLASQIKSRRD